MTNYLFLTIIVIAATVQSVFKKSFNEKVSGATSTFSAASTLFALFFFIATLTEKFVLSKEYMIYSFVFAISFSVAAIFLYLALAIGPISLTSLITSFSLLLPTIYGLIYRDEEVSLLLIIGLVLLIISLILINLEKKSEEKNNSLKWFVYVFIAFISNGSCSIIQNLQQIKCDGKFKNDFMIVALIICTVVMFIFSLIFERKKVLKALKSGFVYYSLCGVANGLVNYLVIVLSLRMAASIMFPIISAGGIILTFFISIFLYKEKLSINQIIGIFLGTFAVVFLSV